jgi:hypothetical protein
MKKVTEQDLNQKVGSLRDYMNVIEAYAPGTAPVPAAPAAPAAAPAQSGWDQFKSWATTPIVGDKSAAAQGAKPLSFGQPAATAAKPSSTPATAAKADPAVLAIQQELISRGAKIKADGIMGPATQAAQKQFATGGPGAAPVADPLQARIDQNAAYFKMTPEQRAAADATAKSGATAPAAVPAAAPTSAWDQAAAQAAVSSYKQNPNAKPYDADFGSNAPGAPGSAAYELVHPSQAAPAASQEEEHPKGGIVRYNENVGQDHVTFGHDQELARIISLSRR